MKVLALILTLAAGSALAASPDSRPVRDRVEASMLVTGEIDIDPEGAVSSWRLDQPEKLPPAVVELLGSHVPRWRFRPVLIDGRPAAVRTSASIHLKARKAGDDSYFVEIAGARFSGASKERREDVPTSRRMYPPVFPGALAREGAGGTVYLLIRIARDGSVEDVMAERVDLKVAASEPRMRRMRDRFEQVAVGTARNWTFNPPRQMDDQPYWMVRVPIDFVVPGARLPLYGEWNSYIPGPRRPNPWSQEDDGVSPDTLAAGGVYPVGRHGPELLTPLSAPRG
ncbi:energy transducer TonB [Marilutibacter chinensis]|uniref:Energy transducer TonB n=1 Tax=Marilutibacter chinensis TaxID=2912247 RepID=A0ABS9HRT6_9GAMM|nr:energy transducer TonB [Lysobacter chinensis]MCF7221646.1 energy transducer TonB [Lysobacter chinensis]